MTEPRSIDVNCDAGELEGNDGWQRDVALSHWASSLNIACGFHAGNLDRIFRLAQRVGPRPVSLGAHPGYADRKNFGRVPIELPKPELRNLIAYQIGVCTTMLTRAGRTLDHVKLHGALYHLAERDSQIANLVADLLCELAPKARVILSANGFMQEAAQRRGLFFHREAYPDRSYLSNGTLVPRSSPLATIEASEEVARRAVLLATEHYVEAIDGTRVPLECETLCLHGDHHRAVEHARQVHEQLQKAGVTVRSPLQTSQE